MEDARGREGRGRSLRLQAIGFRLCGLSMWLRARTRNIVRLHTTYRSSIHTLLVCGTTAAASFLMPWSIPAALDCTCKGRCRRKVHPLCSSYDHDVQGAGCTVWARVQGTRASKGESGEVEAAAVRLCRLFLDRRRRLLHRRKPLHRSRLLIFHKAHFLPLRWAKRGCRGEGGRSKQKQAVGPRCWLRN